jgi:alpha-galactosidase
LKFGIYTRPEWVKGNEMKVAKTFAGWNVDYIKYDFSGKLTNEKMMQAVHACGRSIIFSACEWGSEKPWEWAGKTGAGLWRITYDVVEYWYGGADRNTGIGILDGAHQAEYVCTIPQSGWNDADMLIIGLNGGGHIGGGVGGTLDEYRSQFSLWSMLGLPLLAGNDLRTMNTPIKEILTNKNLIAIQKDSLLVPAWRVKVLRDYEIWKKPMKNGDIIIGVVNLNNSPEMIKVDFNDIHVQGFNQIQDVWTGELLVNSKQELLIDARSHETKVLRFSRLKNNDSIKSTTNNYELMK